MRKSESDKPRGTKRFPARYLLYITAVVALVLVIVIVTYSGGKVLPSWDDIFHSADVGPEDVSAHSDPDTLTAYFIDVGEGDCTLFVSGGQSLLIDSGEKEYAGRVVTTIQDLGVKRLDYVMVTHAHSDHMGGMSAIMKKFEVGKVILGHDPTRVLAPYYLGFLEGLNADDLEVEEVGPGAEFTFGNARCRILAPIETSDNENDNSLISTISFGNMTYLMMGDAELAEEEALMKAYPDLRATVIKLGHHGSNTSSSEAFLRRVDPQVAIISCGDPKNGHPSEETVQTLKSMDVPYYSTYACGTITLISGENSYVVKQEH